ncbi:uncharacterized protein [Chironomus tepperi]|uniref:uncharacterized protein n=1 Tax=Chironomus tepperi TaxID=113505 RepID=UPI00391F42E1
MKSLAVVLILTAILITESADVQTDNSVGQSLNATDDLQTHTPLLLKSIDDKKEFPKETQMAQCTVQSADGLKVQAQATFSKKLDGICTTDDMKALKESLIAMESRLYQDIYNLRLLIQRFLPQNSYDNNYYRYDGYYQQPNYYDYSKYPQQDVYYKPTAASAHQGTAYQSYQEKNYQQNSERQRETQQNRNVPFESTTASFIPTTLPPTTPAIPTTTANLRRVPEVINANKLKSLDTSRNRQNKVLTTTTTPKTTTTVKTTSTTTEPPKIIPVNEYTYYWKLDNFPRAFQNAKKNEIFSHIFNVKGLYIRMSAELNLGQDEMLLLDIEHLAENTENNLEVEMSDGLIFKEIAEEKLFQYSFAIIDQNNANNEHVSPTYWNNDSDSYYKIPNSIHMLKSFLKDNSLLIKLVITF